MFTPGPRAPGTVYYVTAYTAVRARRPRGETRARVFRMGSFLHFTMIIYVQVSARTATGCRVYRMRLYSPTRFSLSLPNFSACPFTGSPQPKGVFVAHSSRCREFSPTLVCARCGLSREVCVYVCVSVSYIHNIHTYGYTHMHVISKDSSPLSPRCQM